jgi:hypothetical protein
VVLTAAHCTQAWLTEGTSEEELPVYVTFEQNADRDPDDAYVGTPVTHPDYDGFFPDVGVVILEDPVQEVTIYGKLPEANLVAGLEKGTSLTAVGYGVQDFEVGSGPPRPTGELTRYKATVRYLGTNGVDNGFGRHRFIKTKEGSAGQGARAPASVTLAGPTFWATRGRSWRSPPSVSTPCARGSDTPSASTCRWCGTGSVTSCR